MASTTDVSPPPPWPAKPTLRILEMSVAMLASPCTCCEGKRRLPEKGRCGGGCYHSVTECSRGEGTAGGAGHLTAGASNGPRSRLRPGRARFPWPIRAAMSDGVGTGPARLALLLLVAAAHRCRL